MILAIDATGKVSLVNNKGCQILEKNENEIIGKNWFDNFLPEKMRKDVRQIYSRLMNGEIEPLEQMEGFAVLPSGNKEKLIFWRNSLVKDSEGKIIGTLSSGEDVTEHLKAEEALRESEERHRQPFENSMVGIGIADKSGKILESNDYMQY